MLTFYLMNGLECLSCENTSIDAYNNAKYLSIELETNIDIIMVCGDYEQKIDTIIF